MCGESEGVKLIMTEGLLLRKRTIEEVKPDGTIKNEQRKFRKKYHNISNQTKANREIEKSTKSGINNNPPKLQIICMRKQSSEVAYVILENGVLRCIADIAVENQKLFLKAQDLENAEKREYLVKY